MTQLNQMIIVALGCMFLVGGVIALIGVLTLRRTCIYDQPPAVPRPEATDQPVLAADEHVPAHAAAE
jgi:hypothetical protein